MKTFKELLDLISSKDKTVDDILIELKATQIEDKTLFQKEKGGRFFALFEAAIDRKDIRIFKFLLTIPTLLERIKTQRGMGLSELIQSAIDNENDEAVVILWQINEVVSAVMRFGLRSVMKEAIYKDNIAIVKLLLDTPGAKKALFESEIDVNTYPFIVAASNSNINMVKLFYSSLILREHRDYIINYAIFKMDLGNRKSFEVLDFILSEETAKINHRNLFYCLRQAVLYSHLYPLFDKLLIRIAGFESATAAADVKLTPSSAGAPAASSFLAAQDAMTAAHEMAVSNPTAQKAPVNALRLTDDTIGRLDRTLQLIIYSKRYHLLPKMLQFYKQYNIALPSYRASVDYEDQSVAKFNAKHSPYDDKDFPPLEDGENILNFSKRIYEKSLLIQQNILLRLPDCFEREAYLPLKLCMLEYVYPLAISFHAMNNSAQKKAGSAGAPALGVATAAAEAPASAMPVLKK